MKTKEMSKSQLLRNLAIPADDMRHLAAIPSLSAATAESIADNKRHLAAAIAKSRADAMRYLAAIPSLSAAVAKSAECYKRHIAIIESARAAMAKSIADDKRHLAAIRSLLAATAESRADNMRRLPEIHKRVRADIDRFSKSLVDFSRLNAGTVKLLEVLPLDSRQATFPCPPLIGGPTEGILNQREPLNEPSTDLTPAVTDDVFVEKVFLVTGSDEAANHPVARFIEKLGFKVITLDEQPNRGQTRIEKFEDCRDDANFAVILLTPDDIGKSKDEQGKPKFRPSQDSIFGLAACMTQHGRDRICCLSKGKLELPSIMEGIIRIPMDSNGGWKLNLVKELEAAGLPIKLKKVI